MSYDRLVQIGAVFVVLAGLLGAILLVPTINQQRRDLHLVYDDDLTKDAPQYVLIAAAMGSFRGLAADVLWYRLERLKQQGKLHEAHAMAQWITRLQPRFEQVWSFQAWNMAYNISVQTHTPEERWAWVSNGVELLRDEGIPKNPRSIRLYRELGWIFFHKIGKNADDMHWYYKMQLAEEWQRVLGAPHEGARTAEVIAAFAPIAEAADHYPNLARGTNRRPRLARATRDSLTQLAEANAAYADQLYALADAPLSDFLSRAPQLQARLRSDRREGLAQALQPLLDASAQRYERTRYDALTQLMQDEPAVVPMVEQMRSAGLEPDHEALTRLGRLELLLRYVAVDVLRGRGAELLQGPDAALLTMLVEHRGSEGYEKLLAFMRARVLMERYHMEPQYMYQLMVTFDIPLDWRHPASHAIYWSALGVERSMALRTDLERVDKLNTDRQVIHSLQLLMFEGRVNYDPFAQRIDLLPDPRYIPAYAQAMEEALERLKASEAGQRRGPVESFEAGHENFLLKAIQHSYIYGDEEQARHYYAEVRRRYGHRPQNQRSGRYLMPMEDLVAELMLIDMNRDVITKPAIEELIGRAISHGLAMGRPTVFERHIAAARELHARYQAERHRDTPTAPGFGRLSLPPFDVLLVDTYVMYMRSHAIDIMRRHRAYQNTPADMASRAFPRFRAAAYQQAEQIGFNPVLLFPPPPGFDEGQILDDAPASQPPSTIDRF